MTNAQVARALRMAALVAASLGLPQMAAAQGVSEEQRAAIRAACRSDYISHCAGVPPGGAQALACLREHLAGLSAPCQEAVNAVGAAAPAPAAQSPAPPAPSAAESPSPAPAAPAASGDRAATALARMQPTDEQFGLILEACGPDLDSQCASSAPGPGWQLECLREHAAALSTGCEQVLVAIASTAPAPAAAAPSPPPGPPPAAAPAPAAPAVAAPAPAPAQRARPSREQIVALFQSCRRDMREYCAFGGGGPGMRIRCLRDNAANLSPECQDALAAVATGAPGEAGAAPPPAVERPGRPVSPREVIFLIRSACGPDFRAYCRGAGFGPGRAIGCLRENAANLSPTCRNALASISGRR